MSLHLRLLNACDKDYEAMPGDARRRFCDTCGKHVHDISTGTEQEARQLLAENRGRRVCVRFARTSSGEIRFRAAAAVAVVAAAAASLAACSAADQVTQPTVQVGPLPPAPPKPDAGPPDDTYFVGDVTEP